MSAARGPKSARVSCALSRAEHFRSAPSRLSPQQSAIQLQAEVNRDTNQLHTLPPLLLSPLLSSFSSSWLSASASMSSSEVPPPSPVSPVEAEDASVTDRAREVLREGEAAGPCA